MNRKQTGIKTEALLGDEGRLMAPIFPSSRVGIAVFDEQLRYRSLNDALGAINGLEPEAHVGKRPHELFGNFGAEFESYLKQGFSDGEPSVFVATGFMPTLAKRGHWINTFVPIKNQSHNTTHIFVLVLDVTERRRLEDALFGLTGRLLYLKENFRTNLNEILRSGGDYSKRREWELLQSVELIEMSATDILDVLRLMRPTASFRDYRQSKELSFLSGRFFPPVSDVATQSDPLSPREREVLCLLASNQSNKQISARLQISARTVESHRRRVMEKLGLHSLSELVHYAIRHGLVQP
jgi:PAS domain S-box-containing protein